MKTTDRIDNTQIRLSTGLGILATLLVLAGIIAVRSRPANGSPFWLRTQPTAKVLAAGLAEPESPWVWQELEQRVRNSRLTSLEAKAIVDGLAAWMRRDHPNGYDRPLSWKEGLLDDLAEAGLIGKTNRLNLLDAYFGSPAVEQLPRLRESARELTIKCNWGSYWRAPFQMVLLNEMGSITIDDRPVSVLDEMRNCATPFFSGQLDFAALPPGKHTLKCEICSALVAERDEASLPPDWPAVSWPHTAKRWTRAARAEFTVYSDAAEIVRLVQEPALDPVATGALLVGEVTIRTRDERAQAVLVFSVNDRVPVSFSFRVTLRIGGQSYHCGDVWSAWGRNWHGVSNLKLSTRIEIPDPHLKDVTVVLSPNPEPVEPYPSVTRIWGKEAVLSRVPLSRHDRNGTATAEPISKSSIESK